MADETDRLRRELRAAGLSEQIIAAAWPTWWSDELADDPSGRAELRFALARRLGLSARSLLGERVEFVWTDEACFKSLTAEDLGQRAALSSFGMIVGRALLHATPGRASVQDLDATTLRNALLASRASVDLQGLLAMCWGLGIPVIHLRVFPLEAKAMHAMVVTVGGRHAILLGRDARYPAQVAFTLAHEIGHVALRHLADAPALVDMDDPAETNDADEQERTADRYGLELLTGRAEPDITTSAASFNAPTLAAAVIEAAAHYRIEPGTLALCLAHQRGAWPVAMAAMRFIYGGPRHLWRDVNQTAESELDWSALGDDTSEWLRAVMGARG